MIPGGHGNLYAPCASTLQVVLSYRDRRSDLPDSDVGTKSGDNNPFWEKRIEGIPQLLVYSNRLEPSLDFGKRKDASRFLALKKGGFVQLRDLLPLDFADDCIPN